ncbi:hypothetical protein OIU76_007284 [Salix suchowensis]|nr:hypothetical protein OIU76_007284 [Salix suchowensis]
MITLGNSKGTCKILMRAGFIEGAWKDFKLIGYRNKMAQHSFWSFNFAPPDPLCYLQSISRNSTATPFLTSLFS